MTTAPEQVETLRDRAKCPQCEYSLRGLGDGVVNCPECGASCDIAQMMTFQWSGPWYSVPGFPELAQLVFGTTAIIAGVGAVVIGMAALTKGTGGGVVAVAIGGPTAWWGAYTWWRLVSRWYRPHRTQRFLLAALTHCSLLGYVIVLSATVLTPLAIYSPLFLLGFVVAVLVTYIARKIERYVARQCLRLYLLEGPHSPDTNQ